MDLNLNICSSAYDLTSQSIGLSDSELFVILVCLSINSHSRRHGCTRESSMLCLAELSWFDKSCSLCYTTGEFIRSMIPSLGPAEPRLIVCTS